MQMHGGEIADAAINAALLTPTIAVVNQLSSEDHERSLLKHQNLYFQASLASFCVATGIC
jgi:hypothetical protein